MATRPSSSSSKHVGPFDLFIAGLPRKYKWQDLKDLVRPQASHGIHTAMFNQFDATGGSQGEARVLRSEEAFKLYHYLTGTVLEDRHLHVHMFDLSNDGCRFIGCNCNTGEICPVTRQRRSLECAVPAERAIMPRGPYLYGPASMMCHPMVSSAAGIIPPPLTRPMVPAAQAPYADMPMQLPGFPPPADPALAPLDMAMSRLYLTGTAAPAAGTIDPQAARLRQLYAAGAYPRMAQHPHLAPQQVQQPLYLPSATGGLINATRGIVKTESRGVFVSGLKFKATAEEVRDHFAAVGPVVRVDLHRDPKTRKSKGYATILYQDAGTAQRAIDRFDGRAFMGMALKVRHDKETTAVAASYPTTATATGGTGVPATARMLAKNPLIVNGTSAYVTERERQDSPLASG